MVSTTTTPNKIYITNRRFYPTHHIRITYITNKWNVAQALSAPYERVSCITQLAKLSFNHQLVVLTAADVFQLLIKLVCLPSDNE